MVPFTLEPRFQRVSGPGIFAEQLLEPLDVLLALALEIAPKALQLWLAPGVGDVLVVALQRVEILAQLVDPVMVIVRDALCLANVLILFLRREGQV